MRMASRERVASLVIDAPRQTARVLRRGAQRGLADLADGPRDGILAMLDRVDEDPRASGPAARDRRAPVRSGMGCIGSPQRDR
jgi:hypothetical protein